MTCSGGSYNCSKVCLCAVCLVESQLLVKLVCEEAAGRCNAGCRVPTGNQCQSMSETLQFELACTSSLWLLNECDR
jgi:hypothetical protein